MRGEEHAGLRPTRLCRTGQLDDLVVVRVCPKTLGYSAGQTASFTMSIGLCAERRTETCKRMIASRNAAPS
jgi:hypothetical protein